MTTSPVHVTARASTTLPPEGPSVARARGLASATLSSWGAESLHDDVLLLVSELVTNAVVHAGTYLDLTLVLQADAVEVSVTDRHPGRVLHAPRAAVEDDSEGGRGLLLIAALAASWGVDYTDRTKRVWFRLPLDVPDRFDRAPDRPDQASGEPAEAEHGQRPPRPVLATLRLDGDGLVTEADDHALSLLDCPLEQLVGRSLLALCHPEDTGTLVVAAAAQRWQGSYQLRTGDGRFLRVQARHVRLPGGPGEGPMTVCVLTDHRLRVLLAGATSPADHAQVVEGPFHAAPELLVRLELDEVLDRTVSWAREAIGGEGAFALLVADDAGDLEVRAVAGLPHDAGRIDHQVGAGPHGRRLDPLLPTVVDDLAGADAPHFSWLQAAGVRSLVSAPILAEGRLIGTVGVTSSVPGTFTAEAGLRLQRAVDGVAPAVQSARVAELERRRHGWLGYLAEASELLAGTLELEMALVLVAQLVAPQLGPWCVIHLVDHTGRSVPATVWHCDEDRIEDLRRLVEAVPAPEPATARGLTRWLPEPGAAVLKPAGVRDLAEAGGHVVALTARGRALGTLTVGQLPDGEAGGRQHLHLLGDLAPRAAMALDNARLYAERTATSQALQRSLLPPGLPSLRGVGVGVVYEATGAGNEVGGDFYDIFGTSGGPGERSTDRSGGSASGPERFAFAVGDVCGKGPEAAAVTGLARHALRLLSRRGDGIERVLAALNEAILGEGNRARFLTVVYGEGALADDGSLELRFASAGHPAPVVLRRDGSTAPVGEAGDLLGVFEVIETRVTTLRLEPGESMVCFTDGVTERRALDRMLGEDGVLAALTSLQDLPAPALARRLGAVVANFAPEPTRDDLAILVLRCQPSGPG